MEKQKKLSIVIPVFNEAKTIHEILNRILKVNLDYGFEKDILIDIPLPLPLPPFPLFPLLLSPSPPSLSPLPLPPLTD